MQPVDLTRISVPIHPRLWHEALENHRQTLITPEDQAAFEQHRIHLWPHLMQADGRLHPTWDRSAWTGRIHARGPAVQQIPKALRAGIAVPGRLILTADIRGSHLRILAHHANDPQLVADLQAGDVYTFAVETLQEMGVTDDRTATRKVAKQVVNATLNGGGVTAATDALVRLEGGKSVDAEAFLGRIRSRWKVAWSYLDGLVETARSNGWQLVTPEGVTLDIPTEARDRVHVPAGWLQATEAQALLRLVADSHRVEGKGSPIKLIGLMHDGAVWEVMPEAAENAVIALRKALGKYLFPQGSPLAEGCAEVQVGPSWGQQDGSLSPPVGSPRTRVGWAGLGVTKVKEVVADPEPNAAVQEVIADPEARFAVEVARIDTEADFGLALAMLSASRNGRPAAAVIKAAVRRVKGEITPYVEHVANQARAGARFERADHVELALELLREIGAVDGEGNRTGGVVSDRGSIWTAESAAGLWTQLPDADLRVRVQGYAGSTVGPKGVPLRLGHHDTKAVLLAAADRLEAPGFFDVTVPAAAFRNGLLFADGLFRPHEPTDRVLADRVMPVAYQPGAKCPRWLRFLGEIYEGEPDVRERIQLLQMFLGAVLLGVATRFQRALVLVGEGSNGKSVTLKTIEGLLNAASVVSIPPQQFTSGRGEYYAAQLATAVINVVTEMPERDLLESEIVKAAIAGDIMTGRHPYGRPFQFSPAAGWLIATNRLPAVRDTSHGFWRRLMVLDHKRIFGADADPDLTVKLQEELPGIAVWAVEGGIELMRRGRYPDLASSQAAVARWKSDADPVSRFVEDHFVVDPEAEMRAMHFYGLYREWCRNTGFQALNIKNFGERVKPFIPAHRKSSGVVYRCRLAHDWRLPSYVERAGDDHRLSPFEDAQHKASIASMEALLNEINGDCEA
ncbi:MAG: hypothetical protein H6735_00185 [Alphaproteobacteria bacterium]|nr:hypothetical protein [Alphaproteobacteria bacterium]